MVTFLDSNDLDDEKQLDVFIRLAIKESVERNHCQGIDEKSRFEVSLRYLSKISHFVVLVFRFELQQELNSNIHSKNNLKYYDHKKEPRLFLEIRDSKSSYVSIDVGAKDAYEDNQNLPRLVNRVLH